MKSLIDPYYLSWENRRIAESLVNEYDVQIYLEDDIKFTQDNLNYWLENKDAILSEGYNIGFFRIENDDQGNTKINDLKSSISQTIKIEGNVHLINDNNTYCAFWIYDKVELKNFINSPEWKFKYESYGIRERSAVGWHGKYMNRYKATVIPLVAEGQQLVTPTGCAVHHLPNNYIGSRKFCKIDFPLRMN